MKSNKLFLIGKDRPVRTQKRPVVEVALFFDEAGHKIFAPYMNNNEKQMRDMLLAYLNGVSRD